MTGRGKPMATFIVTSVALFMSQLDNLVVTMALPAIKSHLHASLTSLEWTVNAYTLTFAVLLLPGATLGDRFGRKKMFMIGLAIFTTASALAALSSTANELVAARALQGVGGAIITPLTLTLLSVAVPPAKRGLALGAWGAIAGLAIAVGPVVGGAIVEGASWSWIFWLNVPIGIALLPIASRLLKESHGPSSRLDVVGTGLATAGLFAVVLGLVKAADWGWGSTLDHRTFRCRRGIPRRLRHVGAAGGGAGAAVAAVPQPRIHRQQCGIAVHVLRDVRVDLLAGPVPPGRAQVLAAVGRRAHPALDRHAHLHRTGRRHALRPHRWSPHRGDRPVPSGRSGCSGWPPSRRRQSRTRTSCRAWRSADSACRCSSHRSPTWCSPRSSTKSRASHPGAHNAIRELGGVFGVAVLATVFAHSGSYQNPQAFTDGVVPAVKIGALIVALGGVASLLIPRRPTSTVDFTDAPADRARTGGGVVDRSAPFAGPNRP